MVGFLWSVSPPALLHLFWFVSWYHCYLNRLMLTFGFWGLGTRRACFLKKRSDITAMHACSDKWYTGTREIPWYFKFTRLEKTSNNLRFKFQFTHLYNYLLFIIYKNLLLISNIKGAFVWEYSGIRIYSGIGKFSFAKRTNIPDILVILMRLLPDRPVTIELCNFPVK